MFHLHGFDDRHLLAFPHLVAESDEYRGDGALDRGADTRRTIRPPAVGFHHRRLHLCVMREQRQRIAAFHACAGKPAVVRSYRRDETLPLIAAAGREFRHVLIDPARMNLTRGEVGMCQDGSQEWNVGANPVDPELTQRACRASGRDGEVRRGRVGDNLGK